MVFLRVTENVPGIVDKRCKIAMIIHTTRVKELSIDMEANNPFVLTNEQGHCMGMGKYSEPMSELFSTHSILATKSW
jgi:hypothetical protein